MDRAPQLVPVLDAHKAGTGSGDNSRGGAIVKAALMNGKAIAEEAKASLRERVEVL